MFAKSSVSADKASDSLLIWFASSYHASKRSCSRLLASSTFFEQPLKQPHLGKAASEGPNDSETTNEDTETKEDATGTNGGAPFDDMGQPVVSLHAATEAILAC